MHTSQTANPLTELYYNMLIHPYHGVWLPSNKDIFCKIYISVSTSKPTETQWPFFDRMCFSALLCVDTVLQ